MRQRAVLQAPSDGRIPMNAGQLLAVQRLLGIGGQPLGELAPFIPRMGQRVFQRAILLHTLYAFQIGF